MKRKKGSRSSGSKKRKKVKTAVVDDALEDNASSPPNSPKVLYETRLYKANQKQQIDHFQEESRSAAIRRQQMVTDRGGNLSQTLGEGSIRNEERTRRLLAGGEGLDQNIKKKRSVAARGHTVITSEKDVKRATLAKSSTDLKMRLRFKPLRGSSLIGKSQGSSDHTDTSLCTNLVTGQEGGSLHRDHIVEPRVVAEGNNRLEPLLGSILNLINKSQGSSDHTNTSLGTMLAREQEVGSLHRDHVVEPRVLAKGNNRTNTQEDLPVSSPNSLIRNKVSRAPQTSSVSALNFSNDQDQPSSSNFPRVEPRVVAKVNNRTNTREDFPASSRNTLIRNNRTNTQDDFPVSSPNTLIKNKVSRAPRTSSVSTPDLSNDQPSSTNFPRVEPGVLAKVNNRTNTREDFPTSSANAPIRNNRTNTRDNFPVSSPNTLIKNKVSRAPRTSSVSAPDVSNDQPSSSNFPDSISTKKRGRGPTRDPGLAKLPPGERLELKWRYNRPVGPNANVFKSRCTVLVRDATTAPLNVKGWAGIEEEKRNKMFDLILENFKVEGQKDLVWRQMNVSYRNYRSQLKKKYFEPYEDPEVARAIVPPDVARDDWDYLVDLWNDEEWQKVSRQNKMSRAASTIVHTTGSKSAQQRAEEEFEETGQEIGRLRLWEATHTTDSGQALNEETQNKLEQIKELSSQINEGALEMNEHEVMVEVFGPERHGRVRGYGTGVAPSHLWGPNSSLVCNLQTKLQESERRHSESKTEVEDLKNRVDHMGEILQQLLDGRLPINQTRSNVP